MNNSYYRALMSLEVAPYKANPIKPELTPLCYKTSWKDKWFILRKVGLKTFLSLYKFEKQYQKRR